MNCFFLSEYSCNAVTPHHNPTLKSHMFVGLQIYVLSSIYFALCAQTLLCFDDVINPKCN